MKWTRIEGRWDQFESAAQKHWVKLTDDDLAAARTNRTAFAGRVRERYGLGSEEAENQVNAFMMLHL